MTDQKNNRFKTLIAEGVVIVISILLAFAIDAMWAQHQVEQEEQVALDALKDEFQTNLEQLDFTIDYYLQGRRHMSLLFNSTDDEINGLPQAKISDIMLSTSNPVTFDPILGTSKSLVDSGKLGIIQDPELRRAITSFLNIISDFEEDEYYLREGALDLWRTEVRLGGPWTDSSTERSAHGTVQGYDFITNISHAELLKVRRDETFKSMATRFHLNVGYYILELNRARASIEEILRLVQD